MSEPTTRSPVSEEFLLGQPFSARPGVVCLSALHKETEKRYVIKRITLPATQVQAQALLLSGFTPEGLTEYYHELAQGICQETETLKALSGHRGFLPFHSQWLEPLTDGSGWVVSLAAPHRRSLRRELRRKPMTHAGAVQLGIDLCAALSVCREAGWLYTDLKPENIFRLRAGDWRIGDLGFAPLKELSDAFLPHRQRSFYTAPETTDALASLNGTMDTYALGMILYQIFNGGVLPFSSESEHSQWLAQQAAGREMPAPKYANDAMTAIIMKACAPTPAARYETPDEMGFALLRYQQKEKPGELPLYELPAQLKPEKDPEPPIQTAPIQHIPEGKPEPEPEPVQEPEPKAKQAPPKAPKPVKVRKPLPKGPLVLLLCVLASVWAWMTYEKNCIHTIDAIVCQGSGTSLTVTIDTDMDMELLTVICKDNYGNASRQQPKDGTATFENLLPGAQYILNLAPSGIHQLRGQTTASYSTPSDTRITHLTAVTGQESGSAIISFGVEGIDSESWTLTYSAQGQAERTTTFADHTVVITGLTVGAEYHFTLTAPVDIQLVGQTSLTHTASDLVYPMDLTASAYEDGQLTVTWENPGGVALWMAHCYDDAGCDQLLECAESKAVFENITPGSIYTIEVTASNMTVGKRIQFEVKAG